MKCKPRKYRSQGVQSKSFRDWARANNRTIVSLPDGHTVSVKTVDMKNVRKNVSADVVLAGL